MRIIFLDGLRLRETFYILHFSVPQFHPAGKRFLKPIFKNVDVLLRKKGRFGEGRICLPYENVIMLRAPMIFYYEMGLTVLCVARSNAGTNDVRHDFRLNEYWEGFNAHSDILSIWMAWEELEGGCSGWGVYCYFIVAKRIPQVKWDYFFFSISILFSSIILY